MENSGTKCAVVGGGLVRLGFLILRFYFTSKFVPVNFVLLVNSEQRSKKK